jgi:hypothetical protein
MHASIERFYGGLDWFMGSLIHVLARDWPDVFHMDYAFSFHAFSA